MEEDKIVLTIRPRRLTHISGSEYIALPHDWLAHHNLYKKRSVKISIDAKSRLIIEPL